MRWLCLLSLACGCVGGYGKWDAFPPSPPPIPADESYGHVRESRFRDPDAKPRSTFSIDVDTASYSNVRRFLDEGRMPPPDAVRIEELLNYFPYDYAPPEGDAPIAVHVAAALCPWDGGHRLVRVALKAREADPECRPPMNLVFLLDVSGSMADDNKLPLVKRAMKMLLDELGEEDRVAIVVYRERESLVLPPTPGDRRRRIAGAIDRLEATGGTNGAAGLELAYRVAEGRGRVILATDGDFNVGVTEQGALTRLIEDKARGGVFLTVLGVGTGNLKDSTLERLADRGNGSYAYIDTAEEARKVLIEEGTLRTVARDVKVQVEFNPARVKTYRLIGYENRALRAEDFNDDEEDAGDLCAGGAVTALYEIECADAPLLAVDPLRYGEERGEAPEPPGGELLFVKIRYQLPGGGGSRKLSVPLLDGPCDEPRGDFRFAAAVACWGMLLKGSDHGGEASYGLVRRLAAPVAGRDDYREEFLSLVKESRELSP
jgi:Ca-activated chloride channel family protein